MHGLRYQHIIFIVDGMNDDGIVDQKDKKIRKKMVANTHFCQIRHIGYAATI